jgi:hypothetical protein
VENPAISEQSAFGGDRIQLSPWVDTILTRHW